MGAKPASKTQVGAGTKAPERTIAEAFPQYIGGQVIADSATLKWPGLFVRRYRFPPGSGRVSWFPPPTEPLIAGIIAGSAEFEEREVGGDLGTSPRAAWRPVRHPVKDPI